jgi:hypothetical protein
VPVLFVKRPAHLVSVLLALGLGGCRACANDHPYVPPSADGGPVTAALDGSAPLAIDVDGGSMVEPSLVAPADAMTWNVEGMKLDAGGREFVLALLRDFDGDGKKDALAIVRPPAAERKPGSSTGDLVFISGADNAHIAMIASGPALAPQSSCAPVARLEKIGPRAAFAEIGSACPRGAGSRAVVVVRLNGPLPAVAFDATIVDPPQAPKLSIDADSVDRDKDGNDDVVLRVAIEGGGAGGEIAPKLAAKLAFFDRPAGPSRDSEEPEASLKPIAAQLATRASKPKDAPSVPPAVRQLRALYRAICLEGGAARLTKIHGGASTPCGLMKSLEDANVAEVRAYVTQGDALRAFAAAEGAQLAPATKTAAKTVELQKLLNDVAPAAEARNVRAISAIADAPRGEQPEWGPLAFDPAGKLLVRHGKQVVAVDPESGDEQASDVQPWKDEVVSPDGKSRWIEAYHACEGVSLRATFAPTGADGDMSDVLLPIAPRLGKSCNGGKGEPAQTIPIAWGPRGLEALVAGQPVLIKPQPPEATALTAFLDEVPPAGSPRAHGAKAFAFATSTGVLVRRPNAERWALLKSSDLQPYGDLKRCTISDDGSRVACLKRGKVVVATMP